MLRLLIPFSIAFTLIAALLLSLTPSRILAMQPPPPEPVYRLNSEGDEWILVNPDQVAPSPSAPAAIQQDERQDLLLEIPPPAQPGPEAELGLALDRARGLGPEAVLAFVASQPDPHQPLLEAALIDANIELASDTAVSPSAPDVPRVSRNSGPCTYETIQAAVTAAVNGDTIRVAAGLYLESIDIVSKNLTITGGYDSSCTTPVAGGMSQIQASAVGSVVDVLGTSVVTLNNLDLSGGTSFGAGVDLVGSSRVTLSNTDVHDNSAGASGGGLYIGATSVVTFSNDSDIYNNTATAGGGAIVYGSLYGFDTSSDIYNNSSTSDGGGFYLAGGILSVDNADIVANIATNRGGGIYSSIGVITLTNSVFVGETAPCCQSAANGGGIYADNSQVNLLGSATSVLNNTATTNGGGLYLINGSRLVVTGGSVGYQSSSVAGNDAVLGAGIYTDGSTIDFQGRIVNNIASTSGGGLYATNSTITMTNATVGGDRCQPAQPDWRNRVERRRIIPVQQYPCHAG